MPQTDQDVAALFKQAQKVHRKKQWQEAKGLYEMVVAADAMPKLTALAQARLVMVATQRRPNGTAGFWALGWHLGVPVALALPGLSGPILEWLPLLLAIVSLVIAVVLTVRAMFEPGALNKVAAVVSLLVFGFYVLSSMGGYENNTRARVHLGLSIASAAKMGVNLYYGEHGSFPANNAEAGVAEPSELRDVNVYSVVVNTGGVVIITFRGNKLEGHSLILVPSANEAGVTWSCLGGSLPNKYRSSECRR